MTGPDARSEMLRHAPDCPCGEVEPDAGKAHKWMRVESAPNPEGTVGSPELEPWFSPIARVLENARDRGQIKPPLDPLMAEIADTIRSAPAPSRAEIEALRNALDALDCRVYVGQRLTALVEGGWYIADSELPDLAARLGGGREGK